MNNIEFEQFEVWDGYWCFRPTKEVDLRILETLSYSSRSTKGKREIWIQKNEGQETPTKHQIETLNYLRNNQNDIIVSTFTYYRNVILPVYQDATDIDEKDIAYHGTSILYQNGNAIDFFEGGEDNYDATKLYEEQVNSGQLIRTNLYHLNGETVFREQYKYDEKIIFNLKRGIYRTFIQIDGSEMCPNFYVPKDLKEFTLRQILTNE